MTQAEKTQKNVQCETSILRQKEHIGAGSSECCHTCAKKKKSGFEWKIDLYSTNTVLIGSTAQR